MKNSKIRFFWNVLICLILFCNPAFAAKVAPSFSEGLAWFSNDGEKYGFIDTKGNIIIEPQFESASNFHNGLALVSYSKNGALNDYYIDQSGNTVIKSKNSKNSFYFFGDFSGTHAVIEVYKPSMKNNEYTNIKFVGYNILNSKGDILSGSPLTYVSTFSEDGIAKVGTGTFPSQGYGMTSSSDPVTGIAISEIVKWSGNDAIPYTSSYYFIDENGNQVGKNKWEYANFFSEGLAAVGTQNAKGNAIWGYINTNGETVVQPQWISATSFSEGYAWVSDGFKYYCINTNGETVFESDFDAVFPFSEGLARFKDNDLFGYVNTAGEIVIDAQWDNARDFIDGHAVVSRNEKYGVIDFAGNLIIDTTWDNLFNKASWPYFAAYSNDQYTILDVSGNPISDNRWSSVYTAYSSNDLICIKQDNLYGFVNAEGNTVLEPQFDKVGMFNDGAAIVWKDETWYIINEEGTIVF